MRRAWLSAFLVLGVVALPGSSQAPNINFSQAVTIAQKGNSGLTLLFSRIENKSSGQVWGMYFLMANGKILEKEVQGNTGQIVVDQVIDQITNIPPILQNNTPGVVEALRVRTATKLPNLRYIEIALDKNGGQATGYQLVLNGTQILVQITGTSSNGSTWTTKMDMTTGNIGM